MPSPSRTVRTEEFYVWDRNTKLTPEELNRRFLDIHFRLLFAETEKLSDEALRQQISDNVLGFSEAVIAGLRDKLLSLTQLEWLTATSATPNTLVEGATRTFEIPEDQRELFTPGPYVVLTREGAPDTYAVARSQSYSRETGLFDVTMSAVFTPEGQNGPWSDWEIGSLAGATLAQMTMLQQGAEARDEAVAAQQDIQPRHLDIIERHALIAAAVTIAIQKRDDAVAAAAAAQGFAASIDTAAIANALAALGAVASAAEIRAVADNAKKMTAKGYGDAQAYVDLGDITGTITLDLKAGTNFRGRLIGNVILAEPVNKWDGYVGILSFTQDATGSRTLSLNTAIKKTAAITLSTAAGANDDLTLYCVGLVAKVTPLLKAFA